MQCLIHILFRYFSKFRWLFGFCKFLLQCMTSFKIFKKLQKIIDILQNGLKTFNQQISKNAIRESCKYIWVSLFFLSRAPRRLQTTHGPENLVSLFENRSFHERHSFYLYFSSANPSKSAKIEPRWLGKLPNVTTTFTEGSPKVHRRFTERSPKVKRW